LTLRRKVSILGSTGSIGVSTLDLLAQAKAQGSADVQIIALTAGKNVEALIAQALAWRPVMAVIEDEAGFEALRSALAGTGIAVGCGAGAVLEAAGMEAEWVMSAIVGVAGLPPTVAAVKAGATVGLANKESIVCAGLALIQMAKQYGSTIIPVDSEHSAIFQVLQNNPTNRVSRLILTASGGPFRTWTREAMAEVTPGQAVAHPKWSMGAKISVDSATMMNKGLEMIEASYLFAMPQNKIDVLVHPESVIHSLVEYQDGSTLAQLGPPDMRSPISVALAWPDRLPWPAAPLNLVEIGRLNFEAPDLDRFPSISLAREALMRGGGAPAAMNAANEVAVAAFLDGHLGFLDIAAVTEETLDQMNGAGDLGGDPDIDMQTAILTDASARRVAARIVSQRSN
jgi:1-deoxy-D-xylulose-5-phosphate reductoisomerase